MGSHCWFHFAVHGMTDDHTPVDGGLELADGRLTIRRPSPAAPARCPVRLPLSLLDLPGIIRHPG